MKQFLITLLLLGTLSFSLTSEAQQAQDFGDYVVHYNALNTNLIPPQVAQSYGIQRSPNRALINITGHPGCRDGHGQWHQPDWPDTRNQDS